MPELNVIVRAKRTNTHADILVKHKDTGKVLTRRVTWSKIDTPDKFATWLLAQNFNTLSDVATELEHEFDINYQVVTEQGEFGEDVTYKQLVNVTTKPTPRKELMIWIEENAPGLPQGQNDFMNLLHNYLEVV